MKLYFASASISLLGMFAQPLLSQEAPAAVVISTDRPSVGSGTDLAPPHWIVAENGVGWAGRGGNSAIDWPESLLRYGVSKQLELRFQSPNLQELNRGVGMGRQDGSAGAKVAIPSAQAWPVSTIVGLSLPLGSQGVSSGGWDPSLLLTTSHTWTPRFSSFESADAAWVSHGSAGRREATQLAFDGLWKISDAVTTYVEYAPLLSVDPQASGYTTDVGAMLVIARRTQLDARIGVTVNNAGVTAVVGFGYSFCFPRWGAAEPPHSN